MSAEEIIKLAYELGLSVSQSQELNELKQVQAQTMSEKETYNLIMSYQEAKAKIENKYNDNLLVTKSEEDHLNILEQQLNNNPTIAILMDAQEQFDNLMQAVYFAMNQAISGNDCSSGCESCGGGCAC